MSIRNRLWFYLFLPVLICIIFITGFLTTKWYKAVLDGLKNRLKSAVVSCSSLIDPHDLHNKQHQLFQMQSNQKNFLYEAFKEIQDELEINNFYIIDMESKDSVFSFQKVLFSQPFFEIQKMNKDELFIDPNNIPYLTKKPSLTSIYTGKDKQKYLTAYAPIFDKNDHVIALLGADVCLLTIEQKLQKQILIIILTAFSLIILNIFCLYLIAEKIAKIIHKINNTALSIAGGHYGQKINVKGPKEFIELSNTVNTMSECLLENINRLQENAIIKERMYGEQECAILLQNHMMQKMIDESESDAFALKNISFLSKNPQGHLLDIYEEEKIHIHLIQAKKNGFDGMYQLLTDYTLFKEDDSYSLDKLPSLHLVIDNEKHEIQAFDLKSPLPILWSLKKETLTSFTHINYETGDLLFIYNQGLFELFENQENIEKLIKKILKYFAVDGLETCKEMLQKEITFYKRKKQLDTDIHLLCFQFLY